MSVGNALPNMSANVSYPSTAFRSPYSLHSPPELRHRSHGILHQRPDQQQPVRRSVGKQHRHDQLALMVVPIRC